MTTETNAAPASGAPASTPAAPSVATTPAAGVTTPAAGSGAGTTAAGGAWFQGLGPDEATAQILSTKGWKNINDVAKSYAELESAIGKKGVILPGENDPPEKWAAYHKAIGAPEKADGYKIDPQQGKQFSPSEQLFVDKMKPAFVEAGLTQRQVKVLLDKGYFSYAEAIGQQHQQQLADQQKQADTTAASIKEKIGPAGVANAQRALTVALKGNKDLAGKIIDKGSAMWGDEAFVGFLAALGGQFGESAGALNAEGGGGGQVMNAADAKAALDKINGDANKRSILMDPGHPEYKALKAQWNGLIEIMEKGDKARRAAAAGG